jgi:hypothetical protein
VAELSNAWVCHGPPAGIVGLSVVSCNVEVSATGLETYARVRGLYGDFFAFVITKYVLSHLFIIERSIISAADPCSLYKTYVEHFYVRVTVHRNKFLYNKTN